MKLIDDRGTSVGEKLSFRSDPIFLSSGDGICRGGNGNFGDNCSELVIACFRGLERTGTTCVSRVPVVWRESARSHCWNGGRFLHWLRPDVQLHRNQLPNPARVFVVVVLEV